jgi:hypothetical protein
METIWFGAAARADTAGKVHDNRLAGSLLAFVQLASIRLWLRVNESTPYPHSSQRDDGGPLGQDAQAGVAARCSPAIASQRAMSAATSVLCDAGMRGHSGTLSHSR